MNKSIRRAEGFTLVEIMIVVVIIGLLAALAVPAFNEVRQRSRVAAMDNDARQIASAAQQFMLENAVNEVTLDYDADSGAIGEPLSDYVRRIGPGYTDMTTTLTSNGAFSFNHPQSGSDSALTYTPEGQRTTAAAPAEDPPAGD